MKNAFVLVDHHGDNGTVREGSVLRDLSDQRFEALEKRGLVREAKAGEVKAAGDGAEKAASEPENKAAAKPENKASGKPGEKA